MGLNLSVGILDIILNFQQKSIPSHVTCASLEEYKKLNSNQKWNFVCRLCYWMLTSLSSQTLWRSQWLNVNKKLTQKPQDLKALSWSWINIFLNFFARSWDLFVSWLWWHFCKSSGEWIKVLAHFQPTSADTLISAKAKDFCKLITSPLNIGWFVRRCFSGIEDYWRIFLC